MKLFLMLITTIMVVLLFVAFILGIAKLVNWIWEKRDLKKTIRRGG